MAASQSAKWHLADSVAPAGGRDGGDRGYRALVAWPLMGTLGSKFDGTWTGFVYFSGMNFVTLGYANFQADGPIRLVGMMQSLGGFMVLTWSATFIYSISQAMWDRSGD